MRTHFYCKPIATSLLLILATLLPQASFAFSSGYTTAADAITDLKQATLNSAGDFTIRLEQGDLIQGRTSRFGVRLTLDDGSWAAVPTIGAGQTNHGKQFHNVEYRSHWRSNWVFLPDHHTHPSVTRRGAGCRQPAGTEYRAVVGQWPDGDQ